MCDLRRHNGYNVQLIFHGIKYILLQILKYCRGTMMPNVGDKRFKNFKVYCMRDNYAIRDMQVKQIYLENKSWFPAPCNGCDYLNGDQSCNMCISTLTSMFFKNQFGYS